MKVLLVVVCTLIGAVAAKRLAIAGLGTYWRVTGR